MYQLRESNGVVKITLSTEKLATKEIRYAKKIITVYTHHYEKITLRIVFNRPLCAMFIRTKPHHRTGSYSTIQREVAMDGRQKCG